MLPYSKKRFTCNTAYKNVWNIFEVRFFPQNPMTLILKQKSTFLIIHYWLSAVGVICIHHLGEQCTYCMRIMHMNTVTIVSWQRWYFKKIEWKGQIMSVVTATACTVLYIKLIQHGNWKLKILLRPQDTFCFSQTFTLKMETKTHTKNIN
jgi:hypothetical protein